MNANLIAAADTVDALSDALLLQAARANHPEVDRMVYYILERIIELQPVLSLALIQRYLEDDGGSA